MSGKTRAYLFLQPPHFNMKEVIKDSQYCWAFCFFFVVCVLCDVRRVLRAHVGLARALRLSVAKMKRKERARSEEGASGSNVHHATAACCGPRPRALSTACHTCECVSLLCHSSRPRPSPLGVQSFGKRGGRADEVRAKAGKRRGRLLSALVSLLARLLGAPPQCIHGTTLRAGQSATVRCGQACPLPAWPMVGLHFMTAPPPFPSPLQVVLRL